MEKPTTLKPHSGATIVSARVLEAMRGVKLAERALSGDVDAAVEWLKRHGGEAWKLPASAADRPSGVTRKVASEAVIHSQEFGFT